MFTRKCLTRTRSLPLKTNHGELNAGHHKNNDDNKNNNNLYIYKNELFNRSFSHESALQNLPNQKNSTDSKSLRHEHSADQKNKLTKHSKLQKQPSGLLSKNTHTTLNDTSYMNTKTDRNMISNISKTHYINSSVFTNAYYRISNQLTLNSSTRINSSESQIKRRQQPSKQQSNYTKIKGGSMQRKNRLRLTLSCPTFNSTQEISPITGDLSRQLIPQNEPLSPTISETADQPNNVITTQPSSQQYKKFIEKGRNFSKNKYNTESTREPVCSPSCIYKTQTMISYCTCYCCLNALCYHCVNKDDVGYNSDKIVSCTGSTNDKLKRAAIGLACLPCWPCLSLYPIINGTLNFFLDASE